MDNYREQMDKVILEKLKDKIQNYLESKGFENSDFIRENLDKVEGLYVENLIERSNARMISRGQKKISVEKNGQQTYRIRPSEVAIDRSFARFDENNIPIGIDSKVRKLIMTQLTHELLHSGSRFDGQTGIVCTRQNTGLNEGLTQMFTEKIWEYTISPNSDFRYKDLKKVAKILDATFGEQVSMDAYFNHSNALENACNGITQNNTWYSDINKYLTVMYDMMKAVSKENSDIYYSTIMQQIETEMSDRVYDKVCADIVIPKLKTLSEDEQRTYLQSIMESLKDEPDVLERVSETITRYSNMPEQDLQLQREETDRGLKHVEQKKSAAEYIYKMSQLGACNQAVSISEDGKEIRTAQQPPFLIEDESLKEKILAQVYFEEMQMPKEKFREKVSDFYEKGELNFKFGKKVDTPLARKKVFSAMKVTAREQGYAVLNTLDECESGDSIQVQMIEAQKGRKISFQDLKSAYEKLETFYKNDDYTRVYVKDRATGKEISDPQLQAMGRFAAIWVGAAGIRWTLDEKLSGTTYAFNDSNERVFSMLGELNGKSLTEKGNIDTENIYRTAVADSYKPASEIVRALFASSSKVKIVYDFYKMQYSDSKLETTLAKSTDEILYGSSRGDRMLVAKVDEMMKSTREIGIKKRERSSLLGNIKDAIKQGKVTTREISDVTQDIKAINESNKLKNMQQTGQTLTSDEKRTLDEHIAQMQQAQTKYSQQQDENARSEIE